MLTRYIAGGATPHPEGGLIHTNQIPPAILKRMDDPALSAALEVVAEELQGAMDSAVASNVVSYPHQARHILVKAYRAAEAVRRTTRDANARRDGQEGEPGTAGPRA